MSNSQNQTSDFNLDALLDGNLDDLADMPEFRAFPAGLHKITASLVDKATNKKDWIGGHPCYSLEMKAIETLELAESKEDTKPLEAGATSNVLFMVDNEMGQGQLKKVLIAAAAKFGQKSNRELIQEFKNVECTVVTKQRQNKEKTATYTDIVEIMVD